MYLHMVEVVRRLGAQSARQGRKLRTSVLAFRMRCPLVAAIAAITYVIIDPRRPHPDVQATTREMSFLVFAIESPRCTGIGTRLITAVRLTVAVVVIEMVEGNLLTPIQALEIALEVRFVGVVVEKTNTTKEEKGTEGRIRCSKFYLTYI